MSTQARVFTNRVPYTLLGDGRQYGETLHVPSVAKVREMTIAPRAIVLDSYLEGTGLGGGTFVWKSASIDADDGVFALKLATVTTGRYKRVWDGLNVSAYWAGVVADNSTDDLAAWNRLMSALGATDRMRSGRVLLPNGTSCLSDTLVIQRKSLTLVGAGPGTQVGLQSAFRWIGTTTHPLIQLRQCQGAWLAHFRCIGDGANKPSAAIDFNHETGELAPHNTNNVVEGVWIGDFGGEDTTISDGFTTGITFTGVNGQNDQTTISRCLFQNLALYGIDIQNTQSTIINIDDCKFNDLVAGVRTITRGVTVSDCFFSTLTDCVLTELDGDVRILNMGAEGCGRALHATGGLGGGCVIDGQYFQVNAARMPGDGGVINCVFGGEDYLKVHINFTTDGSVAPNADKIICSGTGVNLDTTGTLWWDGNYADTHTTLTTSVAGQKRNILWRKGMKRCPTYWEHGETETMAERHDVVAPLRIRSTLRATALAVTDKAAGGDIGTAAATVDLYASFDVNQTTGAQTLTLPSPTLATTGRIVFVSNVGSTAFTMLGAAVAAGTTRIAKWTGAAWSRVA